MTRFFLSRVRVEGFRGINNQGVPLDLSFRTDAVNSIFAPNGAGKSSVFEALCFAIRGEVPKLSKLEANERPDEYYCNRFHGGDATIELTLVPDDGGPPVVVQVVRTRNGTRTVSSPSGHADPESLLKSLDQDHTLLDYTTFSTFMENSALLRGRSFSSLVGMAHLSQVRQALEQLSNRGNLNRDFSIPQLRSEKQRLDDEHRSAAQSIRAHYTSLMGKPPSEPLAPERVTREATESLAEIPLLKASFKDRTILDVDFADASQAVRSAEQSDLRDRLSTILRLLPELAALSEGPNEQQEIDRLIEKMNRRDAALVNTGGQLLRRVYSAAKAVLDSDDWTEKGKCPACESTPSVAPQEWITTHLDAYAIVSAEDNEITSLWSTSSANHRLRKLEDSVVIGVADNDKQHAAIDTALREGRATRETLDTLSKTLRRMEALRTQHLQALELEKQEIEQKLPPSLVSLTQQLEVATLLRDSIRRFAQGIDENGERARTERKLRQRIRWADFIETATQGFAAAETRLSTERLSTLHDRYKSMYASICRQGEIVPTLEKAAGTERLDLRLERFFELEGLAARPLLSESYRNAFGISVILSAAIENRSAPRFIVLDDITSSFDAGHQWFLMELLRTKVSLPGTLDGIQLIILSHDGLLEKYFDRLSNQGAWQHCRLQGQAPTGAILSQTQEANRLRADAERFISTGQPRLAEPLLRQYLEFRLTQIISKVKIPVPIDFAIRDDRRMVQNCLNAIESAVRVHGAAGDLVLDLQQVVDLQGTHLPAIAGNWVNHYETGSVSSLAPTVLLGVLDSIDQLAECFRYDDSSGDRRYYRSLDRR